jgi:hypothetical protein
MLTLQMYLQVHSLSPKIFHTRCVLELQLFQTLGSESMRFGLHIITEHSDISTGTHIKTKLSLRRGRKEQ